MQLNHLNLPVTDALAATLFLEKYFGLKRREGVEPKETFAMLTDDHGMVLTLIRAGQGNSVDYPATFHVGFIQESEARVNEIHQLLQADGFEAPPPGRFHGSWTFYFQAPGGFTVEVLR